MGGHRSTIERSKRLNGERGFHAALGSSVRGAAARILASKVETKFARAIAASNALLCIAVLDAAGALDGLKTADAPIATALHSCVVRAEAAEHRRCLTSKFVAAGDSTSKSSRLATNADARSKD